MATTPKVLDLSKHYQEADDIAEGQWFTLDSGLEVLVARTNSPEFYRVFTSVFKKHGGKRGKELPPHKSMAVMIGTVARAVFKSFRGPDGEVQVAIKNEVISDTVEGRERMLELYPDLREEIDNLASLSAEEFAEWIDEAGKA